uniref:Exocyst complex component Sec8 n=1 Tax=Kalmanozyma brasiliensis (strain GHG001) TaxID=1365824 RepID=V5E5Z1_KALBG
MSGRSNTIKNIRSKIKHENTTLGAGTASASFSSARSQIPHVGDIFGQHPGSVSIGGNATGAAPSGLGAGPSYVSLAPSDSASNYQGRPGHAHSSSTASRQFNPQQQGAGIYGHAEPSAQSTASFALDAAYSMSASNTATSSHGRTPSGLEASDPTPHSPLRPARSMRRPQQAPEISKGLASMKGQAARIMRGTTAEEEASRRRSEKEISQTSRQVHKPLNSYVDRSEPRAFQSINAVLRKVEAEWPFLAHDRFNSVALALSMLDHSSLGASRYEFEQVKQIIETSLQGTVDDHYESFATAITLHNNVSQALNAAQSSVGGARRRLRDSQEALGAKRADLVQMWQRSQAVKEALKLLDLVEHLKSIPDKLESLMAEKRFLESVNLLVRSLKTIDKPEVVEVGATNDLRAYLKGQEQAMLEILIEELHNHLYLKSYFCDARWNVYSAGQEHLPAVKFGSTYAGVASAATGESRPAMGGTASSEGGSGASTESLQLTLFLQSLRSRPTFDPNLAADIPTSALMTSTKSFSALTGELRSGGAEDASIGGGPGSETGGFRSGGRYGAEFEQNPEADSFLSIEMLLESLARLGKLGTALDIVSQRLAMEIHQLVDTTIDEVDARNEPLRRFSVALRPESVLLASSSALARSFTESMRTSRSSFNISKRPMSTMLRISAGETSALQRDGETMRDLFWTLFSKLDAVLQGHRVVYEVAGMIASRAGFKDEIASRKLSGVGSLLQVWKPIQQEVRTLLHDYLMDDEGGNSARHAVVSVNDVLRDHRFGRDRSKQLFKLADAGVKRSVGRREVGPLQRHQLAVTQALKASVPGLVSAGDSAGGLNGARPGNQIIVASSGATLGAPIGATTAGRGGRGVESFHGAGHRLLVKPDAFNVSVLFQPALAFVERVAAVMPSEAAGETSRGFSAFLDEFVQDVFLPQLEEKVQTLFAGATSHADSFAEDPASRHLGMTAASRPVVKSASNVIVLIDSLYSMLRTTPFHRESYSRLIAMAIIQYYQKCSERFRDLVSTRDEGDDTAATRVNGGEGAFALSASWAQKPEMVACLAELRDPATSPQRKMELMAQEARFELAYAKARATPIAIHELTTSRKKLMALGCLQHSVEWFAANIARLKPVVENSADGLQSKRPKARLSVVDVLALNDGRTIDATRPSNHEEQAEESLPLPLTPDLVARYSTLSSVYHALSSTLLFTLRVELRLRILTYLHLSITDSTYAVNDTPLEPAPHIVELNSELSSLDDILLLSLPAESRAFVFIGLSMLIDTTLISLVKDLCAVNREGTNKLLRNILALQQNLKNILPNKEPELEVRFDRARRFYELLYAKTPSELLGGMRRFQQTFRHAAKGAQVKAVRFEELQAVLLLALGVENVARQSAGGDRLGLVQPNAGTMGLDGVSRQKLNEYLIELHEIAGEHESDDE